MNEKPESILDLDWKPNNQGRIDKVEKRKKENDPTKFYHASPIRFNIGDTIFSKKGESQTSITDSPVPHQTIVERIMTSGVDKEIFILVGKWREAWEGNWFVYEVTPLGEVLYQAEEKHFLCHRAIVVKNIGNARAILQHQIEKLKRRGKNESDMYKAVGSLAKKGTRNIRKGGVRVTGRGKEYWKHIGKEYSRKKM